jgi:predicted SAM-dependent methyltransferase
VSTRLRELDRDNRYFGAPLARSAGFSEPFKLDLGAGNRRWRDGYVRLDENSRVEPHVQCELPPIPFPDYSCSHIYASHFLEHLPDDVLPEMFSEVWRVLRVSGIFEAEVPYAFSHGAVQDPTHRSLWVPEKFLYFTNRYRYLEYGFEDRFVAERLLVTNPDPSEQQVVKVFMRKVEL